MDTSWGPDHPYYYLTVDDICGEDVEPKADIGFWATVAHWTIHEGAALASGLDPTVVRQYLLFEPEYPFARLYHRRVLLGRKAVESGDLKLPIRPARYIEWTTANGLTFSEELTAAVTAKKATSDDGDDEIDPRLWNTLHKMILGMAIAKYDYDPHSDHNPIVKQIAGDLTDLNLLGVKIATVRNHLNNARKEFEDDLKDRKKP